MKYKIRKNRMMAIMCILLFFNVNAQFSKARLKVNGLTCSMCSLATQKQLQTIDFIDSIETDLNTTSYILYFKKNADIDCDLIKKKVEDAGFSVGSLILSANFNNQKIENNYHYPFKNTLYHFVDVKYQILNGNVMVKLIDKGFVGDKEFKKYNKIAQGHPCYQTGKMTDVDRVYHLTIVK